MLVIQSSLPLDPPWPADVPVEINWDSLGDRILGGFDIGADPPRKVVLVWEGAADVEQWSPRVFAYFVYLLEVLVEDAAREGVELEVLIELDDSTLFDALPAEGFRYFDAWRHRHAPPPTGGLDGASEAPLRPTAAGARRTAPAETRGDRLPRV